MSTTPTTTRVLVTGANKGIGRAIVQAVLEPHDHTFVLLGARDAGRGAAAREDLLAAHPGWADRLEVLELDVARDDSVFAAVARVRARFEGETTPLYGLVNNAGIGTHSASMADVFEVNARGMRRVCEAFVPLLRPQGGRIVNVTSASGPSFVAKCSPERQRFLIDPNVTWPQLDAFMQECLALEASEGSSGFAAQGLDGGDAYGLSKAIANAYTQQLAREHPALTINACTPGFIETDMTRPYLAGSGGGSGRSAQELGMKPPAAGARTPVFLLLGDVQGTGHYYGSDAQRSPLDRYRSPGDPPYTGQ